VALFEPSRTDAVAESCAVAEARADGVKATKTIANTDGAMSLERDMDPRLSLKVD
jgi:hypothetical protein